MHFPLDPLISPTQPFVSLSKQFIFVFLVAWLSCCANTTIAQPSVSDTALPNPSTTGLQLESCGIAPHSYVGAEGIVVIRATVRNTSNQTVEGFLSARAKGNLVEEDRRRVALLPNSIRSYEFPVRLPVQLPDSSIDVDIQLLALIDGREVLVIRGDEPATKSVRFWKRGKNPVVTAIAMGREPSAVIDWRWGEQELFSTYELAVASRIDAEMSKDCLALEATPFPLNPIDWKAIDTLIIADPKPLADAATMSVLRSFLFGGGRIWVMLDEIDTTALAPLLTSNQQCATMETVRIQDFVVDVAGPSLSPEDRTVQLSSPVPLKRLAHTGGQVTHSVDGWPAGILMPVGRGELFLSALHSSAWIQPRKAQWSEDPYFQSEYELRRWSKNLADLIHTKRASPMLSLKDMDYPLQHIGNPVVSRRAVVAVLGSFCASLLAFGVWRWWLGEMKWLGLAIPLIALSATIPLAILSWIQKKDIPAMVSLLQFALFENPSGGSLRESAAIFTPDSRSMSLTSRRAGFALPDPAIQSGIKTITTNDFQDWQMSNVAWPTGTWRYVSETSLPSVSVLARAKFDARGAHIRIPTSLPSRLKDPVLGFHPGIPCLGVTEPYSIDRSETIGIDGSFPAEGERWTLDTIVDQEQSRRAEIYRKILDSNDRLAVQTRTLFGWTDLFDSGPQWDANLERRGAALVALPVEIETPRLGEEVLIPYPFVEIRNAVGINSSPIFLDAIGKWVSQSSNASDSQLVFRLPDEVVPIEPTEIEIEWDVSAPRRKATLSCVRSDAGGLIELATLEEPSLPWRAKILSPEVLREFGDGQAILKIEISDDSQLGGSIPWRIRSLRLSVRGKIVPRNRLVISSTP
jgi:hypothetical protein